MSKKQAKKAAKAAAAAAATASSTSSSGAIFTPDPSRQSVTISANPGHLYSSQSQGKLSRAAFHYLYYNNFLTFFFRRVFQHPPSY